MVETFYDFMLQFAQVEFNSIYSNLQLPLSYPGSPLSNYIQTLSTRSPNQLLLPSSFRLCYKQIFYTSRTVHCTVIFFTTIFQIPFFNDTCILLNAGINCNRMVGFIAVYRVGFAMTCFYLLFMFITFGVTTSRSCRAGIHNG